MSGECLTKSRYNAGRNNDSVVIIGEQNLSGITLEDFQKLKL
jgi:hypothetical protein